MKHLVGGLLVVAACSAPQPGAPPHNVAPPEGLRIPRSQSLGAFGIAPAPSGDSELPGFIPVHAAYRLITTPAMPVRFDKPFLAIGTRGGLSAYTPAPAATIPFGCDNNQLEVTPFVGKPLPPGVVWIMPPEGPPPAWNPEAVPVQVTRSTPERTQFTAGPVVIELARTTPTTGQLTIAHDGRTVHTLPFERSAMDGADPASMVIDLTERELQGIPSPVGAWSIVPGGPVLLALHTPGWEGSTLSGILVEDDRVRAEDALSVYLYRCAF
ncbi:MAG: hypothetical protein SFX73_31915 [Kofleriaceae bacterium]|nr:hypothetical protein [Kofleriaceae bacterium]